MKKTKEQRDRERLRRLSYWASLIKDENFVAFFLSEFELMGDNFTRVLKNTSSSLDQVRVAQGALAIVDQVFLKLNEAQSELDKMNLEKKGE